MKNTVIFPLPLDDRLTRHINITTPLGHLGTELFGCYFYLFWPGGIAADKNYPQRNSVTSRWHGGKGNQLVMDISPKRQIIDYSTLHTITMRSEIPHSVSYWILMGTYSGVDELYLIAAPSSSALWDSTFNFGSCLLIYIERLVFLNELFRSWRSLPRPMRLFK